MAYRVIFWKPKIGVEVWLPHKNPLGENICKVVREGKTSELLQDIPAIEVFNQIKYAFPDSRIDDDGKLYWCGDIDNSFLASHGKQYLAITAFELDEEGLDKIFEIACEKNNLDHFDWGN